jgi:raffinose/stachyose/melibiose transport system substrate-binding protein
MAITSSRGTRSRIALAGALSVAIVGSLVACSTPDGGASDGEVSGKLQVLVSSAQGSDNAYEGLNAAFEEAYPDVTVEFQSVPNDAFAAARSSRLTAGNLDITLGQPVAVPDFAPDGQKSDDALAADAGLFLDLTDEPFLENFTPSVIDSLKYEGKVYVVPTGLSYYTGIFYNKDVFAANGLEVPTTWSEFQDVVSTLQGAGVTPFGIGGKDSWPAGIPMEGAVQSLYPTRQDKVDLAAGIYDGSIDLTDDKPVEVLDRVKYIFDNAQPNFAGVPYTSIPGEFASGNFAMTFDGTWNQTTIDAAVNGAFDYGYFPYPASEDAADNAYLGGKVEIRMVAAANAPNKAAALAYLDFFSQPENYAKFVELCGFAPAQPGIESSSFLKDIAPYTEKFEPAWDGIWYINAKAGPAALLAFNYAGMAPLGTLTADQAAEAAQTDWNAAG